MAGMDTFQISLHWAANINESYGCKQNCYFFASVVAEHLCSLDEACEITGRLRWLDLGGTVRDAIRRRISKSSPDASLTVPTVMSHDDSNNVSIVPIQSVSSHASEISNMQSTIPSSSRPV